MNEIADALREMADLDQLAEGGSPLHHLHPLTKLLCTIAYIFTVVSFPPGSLSALIPMVLYPLFLFSLSGIPVRTCFWKFRAVIPLICAVGIWNPILNRTPVMTLGSLTITAGMITFLSLMGKGILALMASFLLIATTGIESICYALSLLKIPDLLVTQILITYRYISLLMREATTMNQAYSLRAPGQKGIHISAWGSFLGQLLLRSMDRATELYQSMQLRGFSGSFYYARKQPAGKRDICFMLGTILFLLTVRAVNVSVLLGNLLA